MKSEMINGVKVSSVWRNDKIRVAVTIKGLLVLEPLLPIKPRVVKEI